MGEVRVVGPADLGQRLLDWDQRDNIEEPHATVQYVGSQWVQGKSVPLARVRDVYLEFRSHGSRGDGSMAILATALSHFLEREGHMSVAWIDGDELHSNALIRPLL